MDPGLRQIGANLKLWTIIVARRNFSVSFLLFQWFSWPFTQIKLFNRQKNRRQACWPQRYFLWCRLKAHHQLEGQVVEGMTQMLGKIVPLQYTAMTIQYGRIFRWTKTLIQFFKQLFSLGSQFTQKNSIARYSLNVIVGGIFITLWTGPTSAYTHLMTLLDFFRKKCLRITILLWLAKILNVLLIVNQNKVAFAQLLFSIWLIVTLK